MDGAADVNRRVWDERTALHERSAFYGLEAFRAGGSTLRPVEVEELGDVAGRSLLHLQCHFGLDTLSWARRGAHVTGVDFSERAVALARQIAGECGLKARFLCARVEELPGVLGGTFDVVFTSYGVLCWLADLRRWGEVIAHFLRPGGTFYIVEMHPFADVLDDDLRVAHPYFHSPEPTACPTRGSYADRSQALTESASYQWAHGLGDVCDALLGAGLRLDFLHEFPFCPYQKLAGMEQGPDGWWRLKGPGSSFPLLFSLKATKPDSCNVGPAAR
jgi:SAM-dependent methyltransferase